LPAAILTLSNLIGQTLMSLVSFGALKAAMGKSKGDFDGQMMPQKDGSNTTGKFQARFQQKIYYIMAD
jgi:hypothetical protein